MKKLRNISKRDYFHILDGKVVRLRKGEEGEIPDLVADIWLRSPEIALVDDGSKDKEIERLKEELKKVKDPNVSPEREALIARAKELGIKGVYHPNVAIETIKEKIEQAEKSLTDEEAGSQQAQPEEDTQVKTEE